MRAYSMAACVGLAMLLAGSCTDDAAQDDPPQSDDAGATTGDPSATTGTTSGGEVDDESAVDESTGNLEAGEDEGLMGECSVWDQDCAEGDKCVPWSDMADLVPDDIRCCPEIANPDLPGEECEVTDYFGSCIDSCAKGSLCLDINNDGSGVCQKFCENASDPTCAPDEACLIYFGGVPFCFPECDPLVQDCPGAEGCYPDEAAEGGTGFICLPTIGGGKFGDPCWLLSSCEPGLICVLPDFLPSCPYPAGCCTSLCDTDEGDSACDAIDPELDCEPWYYAGQMPPSADLATVGACILPL